MGQTRFDNPNAVKYDRDGNFLAELKPTFRQPKIKDDRLMIRSNFCIIQNAGNSIITIDDSWTLYPGGSLNFGSQNNFAVVNHQLIISFRKDPENTDPQVNRLEWVEFYYHGIDQAFYNEKGKLS